MKIGLCYQWQRYGLTTLVSGSTRFMQICMGVQARGGGEGLSTTAVFSAFAGYIFGTFRDKANIYSDTAFK